MLPYVGPTLEISGMNKYRTQLYILIAFIANLKILYFSVGTAVAQWLWCCATNRKVAGSISDVIGIFH